MIQKKALVVNLSISQWSARKLDKKITQDVNHQNLADSDVTRVNKLLISKKHTEKFQKIVSEARAYHYHNTLIWDDCGNRLLSTDLYLPYIEKINFYKRRFEFEVKEFFKNYRDIIDKEKERQGLLFKESDYPTESEIKRKFNFGVSFSAVPLPEVPSNLTESEKDKLKEELENELNSRINKSVKDIWNRIYEILNHIHSKLSDSEAIFKNSMLLNLTDLISILPKLNITNDPKINEITEEMKKIGITPEVYREDSVARENTAEEVREILNKFNDFFKS